ncbi:hypothetical protein [Vallitalea okinawensis]|uniref:hypothetical protein n=1 Tax=Vallitalea okinawensis TaxID=2078660 RepID=UPI000CFC37B2|nr:hypothetical protein [Vallitalea okinawensis]
MKNFLKILFAISYVFLFFFSMYKLYGVYRYIYLALSILSFACMNELEENKKYIFVIIGIWYAAAVTIFLLSVFGIEINLDIPLPDILT